MINKGTKMYQNGRPNTDDLPLYTEANNLNQ